MSFRALYISYKYWYSHNSCFTSFHGISVNIEVLFKSSILDKKTLSQTVALLVEWLSSIQEALGSSQHLKNGTCGICCHLNTLEIEKRGSGVKVIRGYITSWRPTWATWNPVSKSKSKVVYWILVLNFIVIYTHSYQVYFRSYLYILSSTTLLTHNLKLY